jgi:hypothetical protein
VGQERLGPSHFFIPLVLGPLNSLVWYVPSSRYTRGIGWRMHCGVEVTESSTNKQHHLSFSRFVSIKLLSEEEEVLFMGTQFSNLYTAVDTLSLSLSLFHFCF